MKIGCPKCGSYRILGSSFNSFDKNYVIKCGNCFIWWTLPDGFEVCDQCKEEGRLSIMDMERTNMGLCDKCDGNGFITWVDKVRR